MHFDGTISLGNVINILTILGAAFMGAKKIGVIEFKLNLMWNWFRKEHGLNGNGKKD